MIWLIGVILYIVYNTFYAGMKSDNLFYVEKARYGSPTTKVFEGDLLFNYIVTTLGIGLTWPISLPVIGTYSLGKRYNKGSL